MNIDQIINETPDKQGRWKSTTSRLWKKDMCSFLKDKDIKRSLEIGTNQGWTTYALSHVSEKVYTIEYDDSNLEHAKKHCSKKNNITFIKGDAYKDSTYTELPKYFDVAIIDCVHRYNNVIEDINRSLTFLDPNKGMYLIFDDYSHPIPPTTEVKSAIDDFIRFSEDIKIEKYIGHDKGHTIVRPDGSSFTLNGPEGLIVSYGK